MRSSLVTRHRRSCPQCGCIGFAKIGTDYFGRAEMECNDCRHLWANDHGPQKGTSRHRIAEQATEGSADV